MLKKLRRTATASMALAVPLLLSAGAEAALLGDTIRPFVSTSETYDSNVFRVKNQDQLWALVRDSKMGDFINDTTVGSRFHYGLSSLELNLLLQEDFITYSHYGSQSSNRDEVAGDAAVRILDRVRLKLDGSYLNEPLPKSEYLSPGVNERTTTQYAALIGYDTPSGISIDGSYRRIGVDYSLQELKPNEYDLDRYTGTVSYKLSPEARVYASYQRDNRSYRQGMLEPGSLTPVKSDNVGDSIRVGMEKSISPRTAVSGYVGYLNRRHDQIPSRDFSGAVGKVEAKYAVTSKVGLIANAERDLYEETYRDQIYSVNNSVAAGVEYKVTEKVKATVVNRLIWKKFEGVPGTPKRDDFTTQVNTGLEWTPRDRISVTVGYQYDGRGSNQDAYDYTSHAVTAGVAYRF